LLGDGAVANKAASILNETEDAAEERANGGAEEEEEEVMFINVHTHTNCAYSHICIYVYMCIYICSDYMCIFACIYIELGIMQAHVSFSAYLRVRILFYFSEDEEHVHG
jgi:hypothetical protein